MNDLANIKENAINYINADDSTKSNEIIALYAVSHAKNQDELKAILEAVPNNIKVSKEFMEVANHKMNELPKESALDKAINKAKSIKAEKGSKENIKKDKELEK